MQGSITYISTKYTLDISLATNYYLILILPYMHAVVKIKSVKLCEQPFTGVSLGFSPWRNLRHKASGEIQGPPGIATG